MQKRLKSLDEGKAPQIVNKTLLDKAIRRNTLKSKTYTHNKKVMKDVKKHNIETSAPIKKSMSIFRFMLKSVFYIAVIIIAVILLIAISTN